ncbi:MAG: BlaI/MecI/CopY family transcriptional regulator [Streptosporangiales bacterium]|nr:BlaI/MecI/CopY family transcriptional regulator [Streptosporangiales bacterium]
MRDPDHSRRRPPGMLEDEVLAVLWTTDAPMSPADVLASLDGTLAYTTVMTTLGRLYAKGLVTRDREGRGYVYAAAVEEARHTAQEMSALLARRRDRAAVLQQFVSELSAEDERVLQRLLGDELR